MFQFDGPCLESIDYYLCSMRKEGKLKGRVGREVERISLVLYCSDL